MALAYVLALASTIFGEVLLLVLRVVFAPSIFLNFLGENLGEAHEILQVLAHQALAVSELDAAVHPILGKGAEGCRQPSGDIALRPEAALVIVEQSVPEDNELLALGQQRPRLEFSHFLAVALQTHADEN